MTDTSELSASLEDYIEAIFNISEQANVARVKEIAAEVGVKNSSVTGALKALSAKGLVNYDPYSVVTLTPEGTEAARRVVRRHEVLAKFLSGVLGLEGHTAQAAACRLEHAMEPEIISRLLCFIEFVETCPLGGEKFKGGFNRFIEGECAAGDCAECVEDAAESASKAAAGSAESGEET